MISVDDMISILLWTGIIKYINITALDKTKDVFRPQLSVFLKRIFWFIKINYFNYS